MRRSAGRFGLVLALAAGLLTSISLPLAQAGVSTVTTLSPGTFTWIGSKSATLTPTTGWTQIVTVNHDDDYQEYNLGFNVLFEGVQYNSIQIHSNTYISFLNNGTTAGTDDTASYSDFSALTPSVPAKPAIHMCSKDNSYQRVYIRFENSGTQFRIRYEGNSGTTGTPGSPGTVYEALLTKDSSVIDIGMGVNASCDTNSGMAGLTNGADAAMEAQFPNLSYNPNGYSINGGTNFKNNDYRISAGPNVSTFTTTTSTITNTSGNISYTLTLSESSSGLVASDFVNAGTATGCTFATSASSGSTFTITVSSCGEGTLIPQLLANSVTGATVTGPAANSSGRTTLIDRSSPIIASVSTTNGNYSAALNPNLNFTVTFNESVTVTGTPRIPITIGTSTEYASFLSMTDSKTATFRFTVTIDYNDIDLDGIAVLSPIETNTGTISDLATNAMTNFSFTPPVTTSVNVYQPPSAPTIDSITANNTSLTVYFTAGSANGSTVTNYQYSMNNGGAFTVLSPTDAVSPITLTGLSNGTTYQVVIKAISNLGVGLASNMLSSAPTASATVNISLTASATTASKGTPITITAQVNQAGVVTFFWNGKRISGCIKKSATTSATCIWKPTVTGQWSIQALLDPTDPAYVNSYSAKLPVFILKRAGLR